MKRFRIISMVFGGLLIAPAAFAAPCSTSDLSLTVGSAKYVAVDCAKINGNNATLDTKIDAMNNALDTNATFVAQTLWSGYHSGVTIGGNEMSVSASGKGMWRLDEDQNLGSDPAQSVMMDMEIGIFGNSKSIVYLLKDVWLPALGSFFGQFDPSFLTGDDPKLRQVVVTGENIRVPEPGSLIIIGSGLLGLAVLNRKRKA